jgi:hypothetical protein
LARSCFTPITANFFDGDIHDATAGLHKWALEASQPLIERNVKAHESYAFTCVRNPYTRILSSFFRQDLRHPAQRQTLSRQSGAAAGAEIRDRGRRRRRRAEFDQIASSAASCSLPATPSAGRNRWSPTSTGRPCLKVIRHLTGLTGKAGSV